MLVADLAAPAAERLRQRGIEIVARRELRGLRPEAGDGLLRDRDSLVVIPAALVDEVAEAAAEAVAFEEFTADQVGAGRRRLRPAHPERRAGEAGLRPVAAA